MIILSVLLLIALFVLGAPIWVSFSLGAIALLFAAVGTPVQNIPMVFFNSCDSWTMMAIPFFMFAGSAMAYCGSSRRIFNAVNAFFGKRRGGLAITSVVMSMIYAAITGSSSATLAGVAEMARPEMQKKGYSNTYIASLFASSCTLGQMIPPSILMILYGTMVGADTGALFMSGVIPGIISGVVLMVVAYFCSPQVDKKAVDELAYMYTGSYRIKALGASIPALLMPVCVLGAIYAGVVTPTEAGALACVYSVFLAAIYREFKMENIKKTFASSLRSNAMIFILVGAALLFANPLTYMRLPQLVTEWIVSMNLGPTAFLWACIVLFLVLGMFIDVIPILYLTIPVIYPTMTALGINSIQFNTILILCLQIGQMSPPFGTALYIACGVADAPVAAVSKDIMKYIAAYLVVLVLLVYIPGLSTWLPNLI